MRIPDLLIVALFALPCLKAGADEPGSPQPAHAISRADMTSFLDAYLPGAMASRHIPGLTITVVQGSTPLVTKGYGVTDIDTQRPVDPARTLFDVQSVAKLVVSTAVMIARMHGDVQLDDDINRYIKGFKIPPAFGQPITLASLMTHTSGLEDRGIGITAETPQKVLPLGEYLAHSLTRRQAPPFTNLLYTDQGMSLAAYTVQSATGIPYRTFVQRNIFDPLAMKHTFYFQVPARYANDKSSAYSFEGGHLIRIPHYYYNIWPTSSLWTTAADMSHFIVMQLQDGVFDGTRVLDDAAVRQLHTRQFSYDPVMPGVCFDFFEHFENGHRLLIHSGGGSGFASELMLMPAEHVGYFFSYNGYDGSLIAAFRSAFLNRFYPAVPAHPIATREMPNAALMRYEGWYWATRYDRRHIGKLSSLIDGYLHVATTADGLDIGGQRYLPLTSKVFINQSTNVARYVAFRRDANGKINALLPDDAEAPYHRVPWYNSQPVQLGALVAVTLGFVLALLTVAVSVIRVGIRSTVADWTRVFFGASAAGNLTCLVLLFVELTHSSTPSGAVAFEVGLGAGFKLLLATLTVFALVNLASPFAAAWTWRAGQRGWATVASVVSLTSLVWVWFLNTWNILAWAA